MADHKSCDKRAKSGQDLFSAGEPCDAIFNLVEGWAFHYQLLADGRRQILDFALPGAVLGFDGLSGAAMTYGVQALTDAVFCVVPRRALGPLSRRHPGIGLHLASSIARDRDAAFARLTSIGRHSARERVAHLMLELFVRRRSQWPGHRIEEMHLPLTQEHIGDATGLTGVHVNRVLADLKKDGILTFSYRRLVILDPDRLVDVAEADPELVQSWIQYGAIEQEPGAGARNRVLASTGVDGRQQGRDGRAAPFTEIRQGTSGAEHFGRCQARRSAHPVIRLANQRCAC